MLYYVHYSPIGLRKRFHFGIYGSRQQAYLELSICFPFLPIELENSISSTKYLMFSHFFHCLSLAIFVCYYLQSFSDFCFVSAFIFLSGKILSFYVIAFNLFQKTFIRHKKSHKTCYCGPGLKRQRFSCYNGKYKRI